VTQLFRSGDVSYLVLSYL